MVETGDHLPAIFQALRFAASKHRQQKRKDGQTPYINHPIEVAELLARIGGERDVEVLIAAVLHDTIEDTDTHREEILSQFGERVLSLVVECTDDKSLEKPVRKELQVKHAASKSPEAKRIKIADKISNVRDMASSPPAHWSLQRRIEYLNWSERVVAGLRGASPPLERLYDEVLDQARATLAALDAANASTTSRD